MRDLIFRGRSFKIGTFPAIMGILNVTPDSFSDGGSDIPLAKRIERLAAEGARIIDVGGESTRPGASEAPAAEEVARIKPAVQMIKRMFPDMFISVDTRKSAVGAAALECGAEIINDVSAFSFDPELAEITASAGAGAILMHMRALPENMQDAANLIYPEGLIPTIKADLNSAVKRALEAGIAPEGIVLDPGIGFAKNTEQSMKVIQSGKEFLKIGYPLLSGPSRKSFIGAITEEKVPEARDYGTCGAVIASAVNGYEIIRVHNVKAAMDALKVWFAIQQ